MHPGDLALGYLRVVKKAAPEKIVTLPDPQLQHF